MERLVPKLVLAATALLLLVPSAALAHASPIHVTAHAEFETATQGGFQEVGCLVENVSDEPVLVQITGTVTYADGQTQTLFRPGQPILLEPDGAFVLFIFFAIPEDAALGTATFECSVRALGVQGGVVTERDTATFEVVPA